MPNSQLPESDSTKCGEMEGRREQILVGVVQEIFAHRQADTKTAHQIKYNARHMLFGKSQG